MARRFPNQVLIRRYEDIRADELSRMVEILGFLDYPVADPKFYGNLERAVDFVRKDKMVEYERILGHSLSGPQNYYFEEKKNHITVTKERPWCDSLSADDVVWAKTFASSFYPPLIDLLQ
jgi:hypothetical protein